MLVCLITFAFHTIFDETHSRGGGGVKEIFVLQVNNNSISAKEEKLKTNLGSDV